jgi:glycosyltransferase involved in cell wall biosynthesis
MAVNAMTDSAEIDVSGVSIVVPAFNEHGAIVDVLAELVQIAQRLDGPWEIIVVDDGSTDGTRELLTSVPQGVKVVRHRVNRGYGAALKTGLRHAHHPLVAITDADRTYPNDRIPEMVRILRDDGVDMVVGARTGSRVHVPPLRAFAKWVLRQFANVVAGQRIPDLNSGLRIFRRDLVRKFFPILPDGFSFTTTITLAFLSNGYSVVYTPIDYFKREGTSKIKPVRDTISFIELIVRVTLCFAPLRIFLPTGAFLVLSSIAWGIGSYVLADRLADVSTLVIFMAGLQISALGLLGEVFRVRIVADSEQKFGDRDDGV